MRSLTMYRPGLRYSRIVLCKPLQLCGLQPIFDN